MLFRTALIISFLFSVSVGFGQIITQQQLDTAKVYTSLEEALKNPDGVLILKLEKQKLKEFPLQILQFKNLCILSLAKNKIPSIPEEISQLSNLKEVNFSKNRIEVFPEGLAQCVNIERLIFNQNYLEALPAAIGNMKSMTYLDLWSNNLGLYPNELAKLKETLKELDLRVINLNATEQDRIKKLLPKTEIHFSPACDCAN